MSRKKKAKPFDPAEAARHRAEREANAAEVSRLRAQPSTAVNVDPRTGKLTGAWRTNCFNTLFANPSLERDAVDWLDKLIGIANGTTGGAPEPGYIKGSTQGAPGQNVNQAQIDAGKVLSVVEGNLYPTCAQLLFELLKPDNANECQWRDVVRRTTGETHTHAQAAMVRAAVANLTWVRDNMPRLMREQAARRMAA
jgi:hypothetical protein